MSDNMNELWNEVLKKFSNDISKPSDYGHVILPPLPCFLPDFAMKFTTQRQHTYQSS